MKLLGVRHHGPGCARSLLRLFDDWRPDCVLVEGPPEAEALLGHLAADGLQPPVALLSHALDQPSRACYHPFALFSPEWQALRWAVRAGVVARFIDLPRAIDLALPADELHEPGPDPLQQLAEAAGQPDAELWWNQLVEERGDGDVPFAAIEEAMAALRGELALPLPRREALREAWMRQCLRAAQKEGFERIAVVVGAWHLPALRCDASSAKADAALLKGLEKIKIACTWVPWTHRHLLRASGYGAGIEAPGWWAHLWQHPQPADRAPRWLARVAALLRERDLDCASAQLIDAARLADSLAALRGLPQPGLAELNQACSAVLAMGDDALLRFLHEALVVGEQLGQVPPEVPAVPLQRDLEAAQRRLRLKPEATRKSLDLDLREPAGLERSLLLHRLLLLELPWGEPAQAGRTARGSFHEVWSLQWQPEFALRLIELSRYGATLEQAACARVAERAAALQGLGELASLLERCLLAQLDGAVRCATSALQERAARQGDVPQLLAALPPLAQAQRYGSVRQTDKSLVAEVFDGLLLRAALGLPLAVQQLGDEAAAELLPRLRAAHAAQALRGRDEGSAWAAALRAVAASDGGAHPLLQGLALRLLLDDGELDAAAAALAMALRLSPGGDPGAAAAWLEGFLNGNAAVLLHDARVWQLLDDWLAGLADEHFLRALPLVRRAFSSFAASERRDLGQRAAQGLQAAAPASAETGWGNEARALLPLPLLRQLLGVSA